MDIAINGNLFKNDKCDESRNQPNFNGIFKVPVAQIPDLMKYLADADPASDDYAGEHVLLRVSGWKKTAKSGNNYLSLKMTSYPYQVYYQGLLFFGKMDFDFCHKK